MKAKNVLTPVVLAVGLLSPGDVDAEGLFGNLSVFDIPTSVTVYGGFDLGDNDLLDILVKPWQLNTGGSFGKTKFVGASVARELGRFLDHFWIEGELGGGFRFEPGVGYFSPELWGAANLRFDGLPWNHIIHTSIGASIGLNWVNQIPPIERYPGLPPEAVLQIYTGPEIAFSLPDRPERELVFRIHHRSTGYGLMWGASTGSNVFTVGVRIRR